MNSKVEQKINERDKKAPILSKTYYCDLKVMS